MRGIPDFNFPAFAEATEELRRLGHTVFSPAERDIEKYGAGVSNSATGNEAEAVAAVGFSLREALAADTQWIALHANAVAVLPGWENSKGAQAEVALARAIGLPVIPIEAFTRTALA